MELVPDSEFDIPRVDKEEYEEYNEEGQFIFHDARTEDDYNYAMYRFNADLEERLKHKYAYKDSGRDLYEVIKGQVEPAVWDALVIELSFEAVANSNCPIKLLEVIAHRCSVVDNSEWQTLATIAN